MRSGFKADLAHPCSQSVNKWREAGLLEPLDTSKLTGWDDILPGIKAMKGLMTSDDGTAWFLPFEWGNTVLTYRTDTVKPEEVQSLKAFADPKFKDRVSIGDNVDDAYALASLAIGVKDWTKMNDAQFAEASAFLREVHKNVRLYWTDNTEVTQGDGERRGRSRLGLERDRDDAAEGWRAGRRQAGYDGRAVHLGLRLCPPEGCGGRRGQAI